MVKHWLIKLYKFQLLLGTKLVQPLWKTVWKFPKALQIELSYGPTIPLLNIYPEYLKLCTHKDICTPKFITGLFILNREN